MLSIEYILRGFSRFPISVVFKISRPLSWPLMIVRNRLRTRTRQNVQLCLPTLSKRQQARIGRDSLRHTLCALLELGYFWFRPIKDVLNLLETPDLDLSLLERERAKIIVVPHVGSWELVNLWLANHLQLLTLYKPTSNPALNQLIERGRTRSGARLLPVNTAGLRCVLKNLQQGASIMLLPDQRPARNTAQIDAPFFGHLAATSLLLKKLSMRKTCDIFIVAALRNLCTGRYQLRVEALERDRIIDEDLASASYLNAAIQRFIVMAPEQFQWSYRRFPPSTYESTNPA